MEGEENSVAITSPLLIVGQPTKSCQSRRFPHPRDLRYPRVEFIDGFRGTAHKTSRTELALPLRANIAETLFVP